MASADGSLKDYAPGVRFEEDSFYHGTSTYFGKASDLIACGLVREEWLPGLQGNGKTSQTVVFSSDGTATRLPLRSRFKSFDSGHGGLSISKIGNMGNFRVWRHWSKEELEKKELERHSAEASATWLAAKEACSQPDYPQRWKDGVLHHINQAERLIEGKLVFTEFPDIGIAESDVKAAKQAIVGLRKILAWATPKIKEKVNVSSNVFSLNAAAFRNMRKG
nr:hypothetical protein [Dechloromonas sp.]